MRWILFLALMQLCSYGGEICFFSYNVRYAAKGDVGDRAWKVREPKVVYFLNEKKAGVVGFQEVLVHQLSDLKKGLDGYGYVGVGRDDGGKRGEFAPIFYDERLWKLGESGTFWFSDTPEKAGSMGWGAKIPRICTWARLLDKKGKGIYVFNIHWDHQSEESRLRSGKLLRERVLTRAFKGDPVVVMGDFNCAMRSGGMKALFGDGGLVKGHDLGFRTFHSWSGVLKKGSAIDHILTSPILRVLKLEVFDNGNASDHHPVGMWLEW